MKNKKQSIYWVAAFLISCTTGYEYDQGTFGYDMEYISLSEDLVVLSEGDSKILISPSYQGRVITSTSGGLEGRSYGWLNYEVVDENRTAKAGSSYGGEDRLWLGPLGSKYTLFYGEQEVASENWQVPELIDKVPFDLTSRTERSAVFHKQATIRNNIGTPFSIDIYRKIQILSKSEIEQRLEIALVPTLEFVGFESENRVKNIGEDWIEEEGLIAPWVLGMFPGSTISIGLFPYNQKSTGRLELQKYLGDFGSERVKVMDSVVCFKTDGSFRSKIGLKRENALPIMGNYDAINQVLTIVTFSFDPNGEFLSSTETNSSALFGGDVVNSYNHSTDGDKPSFFELESAAPARALKKGEVIAHTHSTFHFEGSKKDLDHISRKLLGCSLDLVVDVFND